MSQTPLYVKVAVVATLTVMILAAAPSVLNLRQQSIAQEEQPPLTNFTSTEQQQQLKAGISFEIDNVTFSDHTASVNGIQLHYVIGGQGDPVVLLHGWPQTWYEWRHVMPALAKNYTVSPP